MLESSLVCRQKSNVYGHSWKFVKNCKEKTWQQWDRYDKWREINEFLCSLSIRNSQFHVIIALICQFAKILVTLLIQILDSALEKLHLIPTLEVKTRSKDLFQRQASTDLTCRVAGSGPVC